jgi:hypothetical protein
MELNLYKILPEEISDAEAVHLADILLKLALALENNDLMKLALAVEQHYYGQIRRHFETIQSVREEPF